VCSLSGGALRRVPVGGGARSRTSPRAPAAVLKPRLEDGVKVWGSWVRLSAPDWRAPVFPPPGFRRRDPACVFYVAEGGLPSPVCSLLRVLTPVDLAPPERPGGKLLWNFGTSPLRLRPPALAGAGSAHSEGAQRGPERGRAAGEARGLEKEREPPLWAQRCEASGGAAGLHSPSVFVVTFVHPPDNRDYPEVCGEASGGVWRRALA
jgi:hypothetical protein